MSILVLGLGELGVEVVRYISQHPARGSTAISVLLRADPSSSNDHTRQQLGTQLKSWKVSIVTADVVEESIEKLAEIFGAFHTVIICNGMTLPPATQPKLARVALTAGVKRYFPWQFGIDYDVVGRNSSQDLFDSQLDVRELLRAQDKMAWVIVSTGMFISFLFEPAFGLVNAERTAVTAIGSWDNKLTVTSPEDIGRVTAELALVHKDVQGVVFVSGDTISMKQLADVVASTTDSQPKRELKTICQLEQELESDPTDGMKKYRVVFGRGEGVSWPRERSFNAKIGLDTQSVLSWASSHSQPAP